MGFNSAFKELKLLKKKPRERAFKQFKWPRPQCVKFKHCSVWWNAEDIGLASLMVTSYFPAMFFLLFAAGACQRWEVSAARQARVLYVVLLVTWSLGWQVGSESGGVNDPTRSCVWEAVLWKTNIPAVESLTSLLHGSVLSTLSVNSTLLILRLSLSICS